MAPAKDLSRLLAALAAFLFPPTAAVAGVLVLASERALKFGWVERIDLPLRRPGSSPYRQANPGHRGSRLSPLPPTESVVFAAGLKEAWGGCRAAELPSACAACGSGVADDDQQRGALGEDLDERPRPPDPYGRRGHGDEQRHDTDPGSPSEQPLRQPRGSLLPVRQTPRRPVRTAAAGAVRTLGLSALPV